MFNLTRWAIEKSMITLTVLVMIVLLGAASYTKLPRAKDPGFIIRHARVTTIFPGASPARVENLVTDKLEEAILEMPEIDYITSESRTGLSIVTVNILETYTDMQPIWDKLRRKIERVSHDLPQGVYPPQVNDEFGDVFGIILTITGDGFSYRELKDIADAVRNQLLFIHEVAKVDIYGEQEERIFVEYHDALMSDIGSSATQIQQILENQNILSPGGAIVTDKERIFLEPGGSFETIEDIENTILSSHKSDRVVRLKDMTTVHRGYIDPPDNILHVNGVPSLALAVSLREGGNIITLGEEVKQLIGEMEEIYPIGIEFGLTSFLAGEVDRKIDQFVESLIQSVGIVLLIMVVSLGFRTGLVVASLIPMAIFMTFIIMRVVNVGLDQISLAALIIALGMLVDNAIVMTELIITEVKRGKEPLEAAVEASNELRVPLLTSSLTTAAAFLPIFLARSIAGEYTSSLFTVVTIALLSSWLLSLTMTPLLCVTFLRFKRKMTSVREGKFYLWYRKVLLTLLQHRILGLAGFGLALTLSLYLLAQVPQSFFPESDRTLFTAKIELPVGTKIERTQEVIQEVEAFISTLKVDANSGEEGITSWASFIGGTQPRFVLNFIPDSPNSETAFLMINTTSYPAIKNLMLQIEEWSKQHFPEIRITLRPTKTGPPIEAPIAIRVSGADEEVLYHYIHDIKQHLSMMHGVKNIRDDWGHKSKKLVVNVNDHRAKRAGLTHRDVAVSLQTMLSGFDTTQFREEDQVIPVTVRSVASDRQNIDRLETLTVYSQHGNASAPLKQVADIEMQWQPNNIQRRNRFKTMIVKADVESGVLPEEVTTELLPWLEEEQSKWKTGYFFELGGEYESSRQSQESIIEQLPIAAAAIVILLVGQFNSLILPLIILLTIPLGIIGVSIGLIVTGEILGFMTFLGVISLSGIVINNAIVLLDRINIEKDEFKLSDTESVLVASQRRLRPILLTTVTTVGGLLPLWIGGSKMFQQMSVAIIFGLIFATFLTLGFVPLLYSLFYRISFKDTS